MKWWVFSEEQLAAALIEWQGAQLAMQPGRKTDFDLQVIAIREFLDSDHARAAKMRGDDTPSEPQSGQRQP